jgi:hypothetical protein
VETNPTINRPVRRQGGSQPEIVEPKVMMKPEFFKARANPSASAASVEDQTRTLNLLRLTLLGLSLGVVTGIGAVLFAT